ncbi:hypothetical protein EW146_g5970 [Bondarzewia mesenterica]|uniref:Uncharacterized protein n=1 Tax=Bondarzewia mesenterica TaxID=1095465 RepID=A0A4S4LVK8_9AGAM|nr:hypothetical protein EW146_g5970 [Bondarzewia mesenterica]
MREFLVDAGPFGPEVSENEEYDIYLFWPSLRLQESPNSGNEHSIYGPVLPSFDYDDRFDGSGSLFSSPLFFPYSSGFQFPDVAQSESGLRVNTELERAPASDYSNMVKMGILLSGARSGAQRAAWQAHSM